MKKILFTGGKGLLGKYFLKEIPEDQFVFATFLNNKKDQLKNKNIKYIQLDITKKRDVKKIFREYKPDLIVHAASMGNVDYCESHKKEAWKINVGGTKNIIDEAKKINSSILYISSNAVFNGIGHPFSEKSKPSPVGYYGKTKLEAEELVKNGLNVYSIIRLMTMYGWNNKYERSNLATWMIEELRKEREIKVVDDIYNNFIYANDAAKIIWEILLNKKNKLENKSIYNVAGSECISRYEFAKKLSSVFGFRSELLVPVSSDYFPNITPRPKNTYLNITKIKRLLDVDPVSVKDGLRLMKNEEN